MIATLPTQAQVDRIALDLAPDVVRIRLNISQDWSNDPAIYFRVILSMKRAGGIAWRMSQPGYGASFLTNSG